MFDSLSATADHSVSEMSATQETESLSEEVWLTPAELAVRWRTEPGTLANQRSAGRGLPYFKRPCGGVLYRLSDVLAEESRGMRGFEWARLSDALKDALKLPPQTHTELMGHLKSRMV